MAVLLTGAGGLFTRLGKLIRAINVTNEFRGGSGSALTEDLPTLIDTAISQVDGASVEIRNTYGGLLPALTQQIGGIDTTPQALQAAAQALLIQQVNDDTPLVSLDITTAISELITQMLAGAYYVTPCAVSASVTPGGGNVGNGVLVVSMKDANGFALENALAETIYFTPSSATQWGARGEVAASARLSQTWPLGSGSNKTYTTLDAISPSNKITNGSFETFTVANTPDSWVLQSGVAGSEFFSEATTVFAGAMAIRLAGSATLADLRQIITGLKAKTPYALNLFGRVSAAPS
ncbi:MAG TPA: hypothetical protein VGJ26_15400, partial [Pirellulales bacterium]